MRGLIAAVAFVAGIAAMPVAASTPSGAFDFREMEYQQPRDPLTGSNPAFTEVHHASADDLAPALATIASALPAGTAQPDAERMLHLAGARCSAVAGATQTCLYRDAETVDEYLDDVLWTVRLTLDGDKVAAVSLDRAWQRH